MPDGLIATLVFLTAVAASAVTIKPIKTFCERFNILDMPGPNRIHQTPIVRLGGLAIFLGFMAGLTLSFVLPVVRFPVEVERIMLLIGGLTLVVAIQFYDDVIGIKPMPRLALQILAAAIVVLPRVRGERFGIAIDQFNAPWIGEVHLPLIIAIGFTMFWIVGMMNAINWSDGLDGLASTICLVASIVLFLHTFFWPRGDPQFTISLLAVALAGAIVGFIPFNWHPSRIILGDTGAMTLGFVLGTISIIGGAKIATALLALGVPIVDMAWIILYRILNGGSPAQRDTSHLHHRLLAAGWSQPQIVAGYGVVTLIFGVSGLLLPTRELKLIALVVLGLVVLSVIGWQTWALRSTNRSALLNSEDH